MLRVRGKIVVVVMGSCFITNVDSSSAQKIFYIDRSEPSVSGMQLVKKIV